MGKQGRRSGPMDLENFAQIVGRLAAKHLNKNGKGRGNGQPSDTKGKGKGKGTEPKPAPKPFPNDLEEVTKSRCATCGAYHRALKPAKCRRRGFLGKTFVPTTKVITKEAEVVETKAKAKGKSKKVTLKTIQEDVTDEEIDESEETVRTPVVVDPPRPQGPPGSRDLQRRMKKWGRPTLPLQVTDGDQQDMEEDDENDSSPAPVGLKAKQQAHRAGLLAAKQQLLDSIKTLEGLPGDWSQSHNTLAEVEKQLELCEEPTEEECRKDLYGDAEVAEAKLRQTREHREQRALVAARTTKELSDAIAALQETLMKKEYADEQELARLDTWVVEIEVWGHEIKAEIAANVVPPSAARPPPAPNVQYIPQPTPVLGIKTGADLTALLTKEKEGTITDLELESMQTIVALVLQREATKATKEDTGPNTGGKDAAKTTRTGAKPEVTLPNKRPATAERVAANEVANVA